MCEKCWSIAMTRAWSGPATPLYLSETKVRYLMWFHKNSQQISQAALLQNRKAERDSWAILCAALRRLGSCRDRLCNVGVTWIFNLPLEMLTVKQRFGWSTFRLSGLYCIMNKASSGPYITMTMSLNDFPFFCKCRCVMFTLFGWLTVHLKK